MNGSILHQRRQIAAKHSKTFSERILTPSPQSQSFSQSYGSNLPTSLNYFSLMTRGCEPWRPDAVIGTARGANNNFPWVFTDR